MRPRPPAPAAPTSRGGFTLAEAAVTIAIVAIVLTVMLQGLEGAKFSAAHNRARKTAYELGTEMIGMISAGMWQEEIESGLTGSFAEQDEPDFYWELALGEDAPELTDTDEYRMAERLGMRIVRLTDLATFLRY